MPAVTRRRFLGLAAGAVGLIGLSRLSERADWAPMSVRLASNGTDTRTLAEPTFPEQGLALYFVPELDISGPIWLVRRVGDSAAMHLESDFRAMVSTAKA